MNACSLEEPLADADKVLRWSGRTSDILNTVDIESEEMGNDRPILSAIAAKGHAARVILPASISAEDQRNVADLEQHGVRVRLLPKSPIYMLA